MSCSVSLTLSGRLTSGKEVNRATNPEEFKVIETIFRNGAGLIGDRPELAVALMALFVFAAASHLALTVYRRWAR